MCGVDDVLNCKLLAQVLLLLLLLLLLLPLLLLMPQFQHLLADFRELDSSFGQ